MKTYLIEEDKFNRILDQILVFHGYLTPWCAVFIIGSYAMYGRRTEAAGNMLVLFGPDY